MKTKNLKSNQLFRKIVLFFGVYGLIPIAHDTVLVEHGDEMGSDPYISIFGWFNRNKFVSLNGGNAV